jgi:transcriptional regulator with XRE-family HTH domain|nr:MAG TPA: putative transcriptional regulator [Caudoviricetes sp.]
MVIKLQGITNVLIMNGMETREIREKFGLSQERFAKILGVTTRTVQNWEAGGTIPQSKQEILHEISLNPQLYIGGEQSNINGTNTTTNTTTNNYGECEGCTDNGIVDKLIDEIAEQRKLVAKSQEQIDRLLIIIEKQV